MLCAALAISTRLTPYWFGSGDVLRARIDDVFFIGFQDRLDEDFELLKRKLPLP